MRTLSLVPLLVLGALACPVAAAEKQDGSLVPSVTVVGTGEVTAKPDMAQVQVGVVTQAPSAAEALAQNNQAMERLFATLKQQGIAEKDFRTTQFNVSPQYRPDPNPGNPPRMTAYQVSNQVQVKVRQLSQLGRLLDEVVSQGANRVQGISFEVADRSRLLDQARREAMQDARRRAELYAGAANAKLGRVLLIQEQTPHIPRPLQFRASAAAESMRSAVPIAEGEQEFRTTVNVTYALE